MNRDENKKQEKKSAKAFLKTKKAKAALAASALVLIVFACFSIYVSAYSRILPNVCVSGAEVGGMSLSEAEKLLEDRFIKNIENGSVTFNFDGKKSEVTFKELNTGIDIKKTAEDAYRVGRQGGFFEKFSSVAEAFFKENNVPLSVNIDDVLLDGIICEIADGSETESVDAGYSLTGNSLTMTKGISGQKIDRIKVREQLVKAAESDGHTEINLKIETAEPAKTNVDEFYAELTKPAQDAAYKYENGSVTVTEHIPHITVDKKTVEDFFASDKQSVTVDVKVEMPEKTSSVLREMLFRDVLGSFSSSFATSTAHRAANVTLSASRINGYILMPGDVFSYDKTIGSRTAANGYREANVYIGNKVESGIGGGICQTSSTLYSAALYANLEIVQRVSHSLPISYVPAGQDATIAEGYIDLQLKNNTDYPVKIVAEISGRRVTCKVLGVKNSNQTVEIVHSTVSTAEPKTVRTYNEEIPVGYKKILQKGAGGFTIASKRIVKENGAVVKTEKLTNSVYRASDTEEEVNPKDKDTPSENLKVYTGEPEIKETDIPASSEQKPVAETAADNKPLQGETAAENTGQAESGSSEKKSSAEKAGEKPEISVITVPDTLAEQALDNPEAAKAENKDISADADGVNQ